jgi:DNA transformation protein
MPVSKSFLTHALDLLTPLGDVTARPMFGGYGLYARGVMFGLLDDDELFLKTDAETLPRFVERGCKQWVYPGPKSPMPSSNYAPPDDALEDAEAMLPWARLALEAAARNAAKKSAKRAPAKKAASKKAPAKKTAAKKAPTKRGAR